MTAAQFEAMKKLWENDCGRKFPASLDILDEIINRSVLNSLVESELLEETRVCFLQTGSRRFRMTVRGIEELFQLGVSVND